tara:strand:+ start:10269 stop:10700 length:432 start_codon:yes stop_codon:yes gene_type:complete
MPIPKKSTLFESITRDIDERGSILSIVDSEIKNVSIIECKKGVIRSNHYHKKDYHFMYVLNGEIDYFFTDLKRINLNYLKIKKGEIIFTPSMEIHATYFPKNTKLIVSSLLPRDQKTYEEDTVRVKFINKENISYMLKKYDKS